MNKLMLKVGGVALLLLVGCFFLLSHNKSPHRYEAQFTSELCLSKSIPIEKIIIVPHKKPTKAKCSINFLIISSPRTTEPQFKYLGESVRSILELESPSLKPCVHVFSTEGNTTFSEMRSVANYSQVIFFERKTKSDYFSTIYNDNPKKRKQINDFFDMIETVKEMDMEGPIALMEDDFVFCPDSLSHLVRVTNFIESHKNCSGVRFSCGLNGIIVQKNDLNAMNDYIKNNRFRTFPIDWILEELWEKKEGHFEGRQFFTYRYQIMKHIGVVTSVGNVRSTKDNDYAFPSCNEVQIQSQILYPFDINSCPNSLFSPCPKNERHSTNSTAGFEHDTQTLIDVSPASAKHSLSELHQVNAVLCDLGDDCNKCCGKSNHTCTPDYFEYINRCEEMKKHYPTCKCVRELVLQSRSPNYDGSVCVIGVRKSRFECSHSHPMERRLCPCK